MPRSQRWYVIGPVRTSDCSSGVHLHSSQPLVSQVNSRGKRCTDLVHRRVRALTKLLQLYVVPVEVISLGATKTSSGPRQERSTCCILPSSPCTKPPRRPLDLRAGLDRTHMMSSTLQFCANPSNMGGLRYGQLCRCLLGRMMVVLFGRRRCSARSPDVSLGAIRGFRCPRRRLM